MIALHHQIAAWASINRQSLTLAIFPLRLISGQGTKGSHFHLIGICLWASNVTFQKVYIYIGIGLREDKGGAAENATKASFKLKIKNLKGKGSKYKNYGEQKRGHLESSI